jgi:biopolymer transport protein ExbD
MAKRTQARGLELEPLNLTPLLDILFNLIFFFVLATTLKEETPAMIVHVPKSDAATSVPNEEREWVVTIAPDGSLFLNDDAVTSGELETRLTQAAKEPGDPRPVRIRSDKTAQAQYLVDVMEILLEAEHPDFFLDVDRRRGPP